jgi:putative ABC transport system substrate-binding protein
MNHTVRSIPVVVLGLAILFMAAASSSAQSQIHPIGVLTPGKAFDPVFLGFQEGMSRLGYYEGRNVKFIVEDAKGNTSDLPLRMTRLLNAKPDMLYTIGTAQSIAAKRATSTVPTVFAWVADPFKAGLIAKYESSNSNFVGITVPSDSLSGKRLEALLQVAPQVKKVLAIVAVKEDIAQNSWRYLEDTAKKMSVALDRRDATSEEDVKRILQETAKGSVDAIYHVPSSLVGAHIGLLIEKSKEHKIPLVVHEDSMVQKGALLSYGPDFRLAGLQSAKLADKILKGGKPSEIPSEPPDKLFLAINLGTAKAIGHRIPRGIMERADRLLD